MPRAEIDFDPIDANPFDEEVFTFDFTNLLSDGEIITSFEWEIGSTLGLDEFPSLRKIGGPQNSGNLVMQLVGNCTLGEIYYHRAIVTTDHGQVLTLWAHCPCIAVT